MTGTHTLLKPVVLEHGERYGRLTVLRPAPASRGPVYECGCECGKRVTVRRSRLMKGKTKSCGECE